MSHGVNYKNVFMMLCGFFSLLFFIALSSSAMFSFFTDSEVWAISSTKYLFHQNIDVSGTLLKPLFHFIFHSVYLTASKNTDVYFHARFLCLIITSLVVFQAYLLTYQLTESESLSLLSVCLILSSYHFQLWFPTVRSDSLATLVHLYSIRLMLKEKRDLDYIPLLLAQAMGVLITLKYFPIALLVLVSFMKRRELNWESLKSKAAIGIGCTLLLLIFLVSYFDLYQKTLLGIQNYWDSLVLMRADKNIDTLFYMKRFIIDDIFIFAPMFIFAWLTLFGRFASDTLLRIFSWHGFFIFIFMLIFPAPRPYFLSSFVPIMAICITICIAHFYKAGRHTTWTKHRYILILGLLFAALSSNVMRSQYSIFKGEFNNFQQLKFIQAVENHIPKNYQIYDVLGLLPLRENNMVGFIGPQQEENNRLTLQGIRVNQPEVIITVGRIYVLNWDFIEWVDTHYTDLGRGVWVKRELSTNNEFKSLNETTSSLKDAAQLFQFGTPY